MVRTSPSSRMTTPLPSRRVPNPAAVKASSGIVERTATTDRKIVSIFMLPSCKRAVLKMPHDGKHDAQPCLYRYGTRERAQDLGSQHTSRLSEGGAPWSRRATEMCRLRTSGAWNDRNVRIHAAESLDLEQANGGTFASINRPIAGPTHEKALPVGKHPLQLYSLATPNGVKVTVMLEELLALGHKGAEYDAWLIRINDGDQFGSGFVGRQSQLQDPGADGPQRPDADPGFRVRLDPVVPRREVRRVPADRAAARAPNACHGCSGRWEARRIWAAASAISTPMRRPRSNMPSTASPWR